MDKTAPISPLVAQLMEASMTETARVTGRMIDNLAEERDRYRATILAIRDEIASLVAGKYMPTPNAIIDATYPTDETIRRYIDIYR